MSFIADVHCPKDCELYRLRRQSGEEVDACEKLGMERFEKYNYGCTLSPTYIRRIHGNGPDGRTCEECIDCHRVEWDDEHRLCLNKKAPWPGYLIRPEWWACALFKSFWAYEREILESNGQKTIRDFLPLS